MSKYLCQSCKSNNNGWCTVRKCNGLKKMNITSCNTYEEKIILKGKVVEVKRAESISLEDYVDNSGAYRVLGKREMLWKIQLLILAINADTILSNEDKYRVLTDNIKSLGTHLNFEEELWNVDDVIDSEIDKDMIKASRLITESL